MYHLFISNPQHACARDGADRLLTGLSQCHHGIVWLLHHLCVTLQQVQWQGSLLLTTVWYLWHHWMSVGEMLFLGVELVSQLSAASPVTSRCPSQPSQVLHFKQLDGFRIHRERDPLPDSSHKQRHLRIRSNASGLLHMSKKSYTAPKIHKGDQMLNPTILVPSPLGFDPVDITNCTDNLPDCVDLSILTDKP